MFQANGLAHPPPAGRNPALRPVPLLPAVSEQIKWSLGGHRGVLAHSGVLRPNWSIPPAPASTHTGAQSLCLERIASEGAVAGGPTRLR